MLISKYIRNFAAEIIVIPMEHTDMLSEPVAKYGTDNTGKPDIAKSARLPKGCITVEQYFDALQTMVKEKYANL